MAYSSDPGLLEDQLVKKAGIPPRSLADVRILTSWEGSASLEVSVIDPDFEIIENGKLTLIARELKTTDPEKNEAAADSGRGPYSLPIIDVNYPKGSKYWWRLSDIDVTSDLDSPNLTLTFEARLVSWLRHHHGPPMKSMTRDDATRAQFIKWITADEIKREKIRFISPEIEEKQPELQPDLTP